MTTYPVITNVDIGSPILRCDGTRDETMVFSAADTAAAGTILARQIVAVSITAAADVGNTGDGTCTAATVVGSATIPQIGAHNLECTAAVTNGGVFKLEDPDGVLVAQNLTLTAGAGTATVFTVAGMTFTVTDGATDFAAGDKFSLTVAADGKVGYFATDGVGGLQHPIGVLQYDVTVTASGNRRIDMMFAGQVRKERLIIDVDGDATNVDENVIDKLNAVGISVFDCAERSVLDNQ